LDENPSLAKPRDLQLKILLSHSPDQVRWARKHGFDLMLCGHTHGGQIRYPIIGPTVCPSWYGVRYASGLFLERALAIHVSRGVSGLFPIRWNCLPEVALLVLRRV
jgi:predicted MPP superfamily phosphohydrolase